MSSIDIFSGIVIFGAIAVIIMRMLSASGLPFKKNVVFDTLLIRKTENSFNTGTKDTSAVFALSLLFRVFVFVISIFAVYLMKDEPYSFKNLINTYTQWDARHYSNIATGGYSYYVEDGVYPTLAFFPLYPWVIRLFNGYINDMVISGLVVSFLAYAGGCTFLYKLTSLDYNKSTAIRAIVFISIFPHALFFGTMMSESMFFFTLTATLYYIRKHNWPLAGVFGAFAAMSRMSGVLLAIPAAVEWFEHYQIIDLLRKKSFKEIWKNFYSKGLWIFLMAFGTLVYLYCNYKTTGKWFAFLEYQEKFWFNKTVYWGDCLSVITDYIKNEKSMTLFAIWLPEIIAIIFATVLLIYGLRRTRTMYTAFLVVYIIINMSMSWPLSIARYMSCAVPAFIILSDFSERHKWTEHLITATMAITFGVFFTGYFMSKQIM